MQTCSSLKNLTAVCRVLGFILEVHLMSTSNVSIAELARRCSEEAHRYFDHLMADLDRTGVSSLSLRTSDRVPEASRSPRSPNHESSACIQSDASTCQASK